MGLPLLGKTHIADPETGRFISAEHQRVAEIINEWNPELWLYYIPPENREEGDTEPFMVVHKQSDGNEYIVLSCREDEVDERLIARLWSADRSRPGNDVNRYLDAKEAARQALEYKRWMEEMEENHDIAKSIFRSPLHTYKMPNGRVIRT